MTRKYYAIHSYMGLSYAIDSPCYTAYVFDSIAARNEWVDENKYVDGNYVARAATKREAYKVAGINNIYKRPIYTQRGPVVQLQAGWI